MSIAFNWGAMFKTMAIDIGDEDYCNIATKLNTNTTFWVPTGCAVINMQLSGKLVGGGIPGQSIVGVSGETQSGKSRISTQAMTNFLNKYKTGAGLYIDTENALKLGGVNAKAAATRAEVLFGPGYKRVFVMTMDNHIESIYAKLYMWFHKLIMSGARKAGAMCFVVLDSLGMLETRAMAAAMTKYTSVKSKTTGARLDADKAVKADAGRNAKAKAAMFRGIMNMVPRSNCAMLVCNHLYDNIGDMGKAKEVAGGGGMKFGAQQILTLISRAQSNLDDEDKGKARPIESFLWKGRDTMPYSKVHTVLHFEKGGFQYYSGLFEWAKEAGGLSSKGTKYQVTGGDNKGWMTRMQAKANPEKFFGEMEGPGMMALDKICNDWFCFGDFSANIEGILDKDERTSFEEGTLDDEDEDIKAAAEILSGVVAGLEDLDEEDEG